MQIIYERSDAMKKILLFLLTAAIFLSSCAKEDPQRNIVAEFGFSRDDALSFTSIDYTVDIITEVSSHIAAVEIVSVKYGALEELSADFKYEVKVVKEFLDTTDTISRGDTLLVQCNEGIMPARDAQTLMEGTGAELYLTGEYGENDWITASNHGALPVEVGKTYLMFLTDDYLEAHGMYAECGSQYLFEYKGGLFPSLYAENADAAAVTLDHVKSAVKNRTGRADEIGLEAYIRELNESAEN